MNCFQHFVLLLVFFENVEPQRFPPRFPQRFTPRSPQRFTPRSPQRTLQKFEAEISISHQRAKTGEIVNFVCRHNSSHSTMAHFTLLKGFWQPEIVAETAMICRKATPPLKGQMQVTPILINGSVNATDCISMTVANVVASHRLSDHYFCRARTVIDRKITNLESKPLKIEVGDPTPRIFRLQLTNNLTGDTIRTSGEMVRGGVNINIECETDEANPAPIFTLRMNDNLLTSVGSATCEEAYALVPKTPEVVFTCEANNGFGDAQSKNITVTVQYNASNNQIVFPNEVTFNNYEEIEICSVANNPPQPLVVAGLEGLLQEGYPVFRGVPGFSRVVVKLKDTAWYDSWLNFTCGLQGTVNPVKASVPLVVDEWRMQSWRLASISMSHRRAKTGQTVSFVCRNYITSTEDTIALFRGPTKVAYIKMNCAENVVTENWISPILANGSVSATRCGSMTVADVVASRQMTGRYWCDIDRLWIVRMIGGDLHNSDTYTYKFAASLPLDFAVGDPTPPISRFQLTNSLTRQIIRTSGEMVGWVNISIECETAAADPAPNFTLRLNDHLLTSVKNATCVEAYALVPKTPEVVFTCEAYNGFGDAQSKNITVTVQYNASNKQLVFPKEVTFDATKEIEICSVANNPPQPLVVSGLESSLLQEGYPVFRGLRGISRVFVKLRKTAGYAKSLNFTCGLNNTVDPVHASVPLVASPSPAKQSRRQLPTV